MCVKGQVCGSGLLWPTMLRTCVGPAAASGTLGGRPRSGQHLSGRSDAWRKEAPCMNRGQDRRGRGNRVPAQAYACPSRRSREAWRRQGRQVGRDCGTSMGTRNRDSRTHPASLSTTSASPAYQFLTADHRLPQETIPAQAAGVGGGGGAADLGGRAAVRLLSRTRGLLLPPTALADRESAGVISNTV